MDPHMFDHLPIPTIIIVALSVVGLIGVGFGVLIAKVL